MTSGECERKTIAMDWQKKCNAYCDRRVFSLSRWIFPFSSAAGDCCYRYVVKDNKVVVVDDDDDDDDDVVNPSVVLTEYTRFICISIK